MSRTLAAISLLVLGVAGLTGCSPERPLNSLMVMAPQYAEHYAEFPTTYVHNGVLYLVDKTDQDCIPVESASVEKDTITVHMADCASGTALKQVAMSRPGLHIKDDVHVVIK